MVLHGPLGVICAPCEVVANGVFCLPLAAGASRELPLCALSASRALAERSAQERRLLLELMFFPQKTSV